MTAHGYYWVIGAISLVSLVIGLAIVAVRATHWFSKWQEGVNNNQDRFSENQGKFSEVMQQLGKDMQELRKEVRKDMKELRKDIKDIFKQLPPPKPLQPGSPLKLSDYGKELSETVKAKAWAERTAETLLENVKDKDAYQVQEYSFNYVKDEFKPTEEQLAEIRKAAYEHGATIDHIHEVMGLELRDQLLTHLNLMHEAP